MVSPVYYYGFSLRALDYVLPLSAKQTGHQRSKSRSGRKPGAGKELIPRLFLSCVVLPTFLKDGRRGRATCRAGVFADVAIQRTSEQSLRVGQSTPTITRAVTFVTFCLPLVRIMSIIECLTSIMQVHAREGLLTNLSATALVSGEWATRSTVGTSSPNLDALDLEDGQGELTSGFYFDRDCGRFRVMGRQPWKPLRTISGICED